MKKFNIIISISLVALTTAAWAQNPSPKERRSAGKHGHLQVMTADYRSEKNRKEAFTDRLENWLSPAENRGYYESPEVSMSFFFENAEVIYDRGSSVEAWMKVPFEEQLDEELVALEKWMTVPFQSEVYESGSLPLALTEASLEGCLVEEVVSLEGWMANPFESELAETPLALESWMIDPFEEQLADAPLELEHWMTQPFEILPRCEDGSWMATTPESL